MSIYIFFLAGVLNLGARAEPFEDRKIFVVCADSLIKQFVESNELGRVASTEYDYRYYIDEDGAYRNHFYRVVSKKNSVEFSMNFHVIQFRANFAPFGRNYSYRAYCGLMVDELSSGQIVEDLTHDRKKVFSLAGFDTSAAQDKLRRDIKTEQVDFDWNNDWNYFLKPLCDLYGKNYVEEISGDGKSWRNGKCK